MNCLVPLCLFLTMVACTGATFYCDPTLGAANGDGSAERPWATIEDVVKRRKIGFEDADGKPLNPGAPIQPGDTLLLRSGWHGVIRIPRAYSEKSITIAAEPGHSPQVGWVEIGEGRNLWLRGLTVSPSLAPAPLPKPPGYLVSLGEHGGDRSASLVVEDCFIFSVRDTSAWTAKDWVDKPASGIWLGRNGKAHVARNNYILNTRFGIALCAPECVAEGNIIENFSADGLRATRDGQVAQYNVIKNIFVGAAEGDDNHDDGIQVFLFNVGTGTVRNIVLRGNIILAREDDSLPFRTGLQGIGCFDGPLVGFLVEDNIIGVNHYHGITLGDAQGSTIRNNVCFSRWGGRFRPWIMLGEKKDLASANFVSNNLAHSFSFKADPKVTASNNLPVTETAYTERLKTLRAWIDTQFGAIHGVAKRPRIRDSAP
jgi:hypothetical protein